MISIREFILEYLQKEYSFPYGTDEEAIDFVENGYIDSIGMVKFIIELEDEFGIEFTDDELASPHFRITGELIKLVEKKAEDGENT